MTSFTESEIEIFFLSELKQLGFSYIPGPSIAPDVEPPRVSWWLNLQHSTANRKNARPMARYGIEQQKFWKVEKWPSCNEKRNMDMNEVEYA